MKISRADQDKESRVMTGIWNIIKKYYKPENSDEYWEGLVNDLHDLYDREGGELCKLLCITVSNYFEGKARRGSA